MIDDVSPSGPVIFALLEAGSRLGTRLTETFGHRDVRLFTTLREAVSEALDALPRLLIFDVNTIESDLLIQLGRLRSDPEAAAMKVFVRAQHLDEASLVALYEREVDDVALGLISDDKFMARVEDLLERTGPASCTAPVSVLRDKVEARLAPQIAGASFVDLRNRIARHYGLALRLAMPPSVWPSEPALGLVPTGDTTVCLYFAQFYGNRLAAEANTRRLHSLMRGLDLARLDPAATLDALQGQFEGLMNHGSLANVACAMIDTQAASLIIAGATGIAALHKTGPGKRVAPGGLRGPRIGEGSGFTNRSFVLQAGGALALMVPPESPPMPSPVETLSVPLCTRLAAQPGEAMLPDLVKACRAVQPGHAIAVLARLPGAAG